MDNSLDEAILIREAKAEYMREWRRKNPEKVKANNQRYWAKKASVRDPSELDHQSDDQKDSSIKPSEGDNKKADKADKRVDKEIGYRLKTIRTAANMSSEEVAQRVGCSASLIRHFECGQRRIHADELIKLADFYGVTTDFLLGRSDNFNIDNTFMRAALKQKINQARRLNKREAILLNDICEQFGVKEETSEPDEHQENPLCRSR